MPGTDSKAAVIDAIISMCSNLSAVTSATPVVPVFDGFPGPNPAETFIAIGGYSPQVVTGGKEAWEALGYQAARIENYTVKGYVYSWVGGDDNLGQLSPSDAQKAARDNAATLIAAIETQMLTDKNFSDANGGTALVLWGLFMVTGISQTSAADPDAGKGRWCQYDFAIQVYNYLDG